MTSPRESMEIVARAVAQSGELPSEMSLLLQEADQSADDADVSLPLLEITPTQVDNVVVHNTDLVGYVTDSDGNRTGRIYFSDYEMSISIDIWTTKDGGYDPDELGERLREALYPYSSYGPQRPFLDDEQNPIEQITYFRLQDGERTDDLLQTPTVRRWSQEVELWGCEEFRTDEDYIVDVSYPSDGDLNDDDGDGTVDNQ
jgi:hypothetical protein